MSREESPRLGLARTGELIAELGMRFRIAEHEAKRLHELLEDEALANEIIYRLFGYGTGVNFAAQAIDAYRAALLARLEGRE